MRLTAAEQAAHGYTITEMRLTGGGKTYGVTWYDTGEHSLGWITSEAAEAHAERCYATRASKTK